MKLALQNGCNGCPNLSGGMCLVMDLGVSKMNIYHRLPDWCPLPDAGCDCGAAKLNRRVSDLEKELAGLKGSVSYLKGALTKAMNAIKSLGVE